MSDGKIKTIVVTDTSKTNANIKKIKPVIRVNVDTSAICKQIEMTFSKGIYIIANVGLKAFNREYVQRLPILECIIALYNTLLLYSPSVLHKCSNLLIGFKMVISNLKIC